MFISELPIIRLSSKVHEVVTRTLSAIRDAIESQSVNQLPRLGERTSQSWCSGSFDDASPLAQRVVARLGWASMLLIGETTETRFDGELRGINISADAKGATRGMANECGMAVDRIYSATNVSNRIASALRVEKIQTHLYPRIVEMKVLAIVALLSVTAIAQEGIDENVGTGQFPDGLVGVTNLRDVQLSRIAALKDAVAGSQARHETGLGDLNSFLELQFELNAAQLEIADNKQQRLDCIKASLNAAIQIWQRAVALREVGARGGDELSETSARAAVFRYRVMWLKEKSAAFQPPPPARK